MQWAPLGTPSRRLLVRTMYVARASVLEMRCHLSSRPSGTEPTFAGSGRQGGLSAGAPWAMAGEELPSSSSDQPLASSSEPRKVSVQLRQSPYCSPTAQALQIGAGGGAEACVGSAAPGGSPIVMRCLVSQPWHQPPVTMAHQSHGPAPSKPECGRKVAVPPSIVPRCLPRRPPRGMQASGRRHGTTEERRGEKKGGRGGGEDGGRPRAVCEACSQR